MEAPPEIPAAGTWAARGALSYVPVAAGTATGVLLLFDDTSGRLRIAAAMLITASVLGGLVGLLSARQQHRTALRVQRHDYLRYLAGVEETMRRASNAQRRALAWRYPRPAGLWSLAMGRRLWERRHFDNDFVHVRLAVGPQQSAVTLTAPETAPVEHLDPVCAEALRDTLRTHATVAELPVAIALGAFARLTFTGDSARIRGLVRSVVAQLAVFHAPRDVRISVCASSAAAPLWDWVKWLPHALDPHEQDAIGPVRLVTTGLADLEARLGDELQRPGFAQSGPLSGDWAHHVVIFDGGLVDAESVLAAEGRMGVTVLDLAGDLRPLPARHIARLHVAEDEIRYLPVDQFRQEAPTVIGKPDFLPVEQAAALARQLAPLRVEAPASGDGVLGSVEVPLTRLLDVRDPAAADQRARQPRHRLQVPIGLGADGRPVKLDLKEAAQLGMGPHGLVVGATGSGKSELLRTLILGLAATHSSDAVNFLLVDYKGTATFRGFEDLRHVSAIVTGLEEDPPLVDRLSDALNGEMVRRQKLLRAAGGYASVRDYEGDREQGAGLEPLPELLVVIDEFSELLTAKPEFVDLLVMMGRLGRSLGVHMLLASQRLDEGRLRGLDAHLSYRIGMRTFSASESRAVLGVPDAYELPARPGWGLLRVGTDELVRFRAAYVSGPAVAESAPQALGPRIVRKIQPFVAQYVRPEVIDPVGAPDRAPAQHESLMDEVMGRLAGQGPPAHPIWLPVLDAPPALGDLLPGLPATSPYGAADEDADEGADEGRIAAPVGIVDRPFEHRRDPLWLDLSSAGGNAAVVGVPQSGKSTLLRTLITSLSLRYTPERVRFYCLDFGGGSLGSLARLPHVAGVATRPDAHRVGRTVAEVTELLERRELGSRGGDVVLVIDGWRTLRREYEELEPVIVDLAARGPGFGIHVVVTANGWAEFRTNFRDLLGTRLEFRLGDPLDSQINRRLAADVPVGSPGRGLTWEEERFIAALPRIDGHGTVHDLRDAVAELVGTVAANWPGPAAPPVRVLPDRLPVAALPGPAETGHRIPIGIDEDRLAPVLLDFAAEPHLAVLGDPGCGKSGLLELIAEGVIARHAPAEARLIVIGPRRSLLDATGTEHRIGYAPSASAAETLIAQIRGALEQRLPPPDLAPEQFRDRSWWAGAELYLFVDDAELLETSSDLLQPLAHLLPQGHDIGFHLIYARSMGGAGRAMYGPVLRVLKELPSSALIMSGPRDEGVVLGGVRPSRLPPGRGWFYERDGGSARLIQVAYDEADEAHDEAKEPPAR